ncbi:MAG: lipoprotein-releasing system ATP-binding protein LolD [Acidiferrobacteraceae bacterium]|nr:lipoprotein-releasing system ATP-binding protein LolD [Acidiferrobacteraceae bacterium]MCP4827549.1 ATP-binding cassette domain-containing protein [Pseudomonadota bacterium]HJP06963.1 ATP-binding cassette domain-containing protein [Arenicellales bacterium]|tara:strand:+ start:7808 stop:8497 length:690 start_codon:yes stop_codon:yes gene_type:complete
MNDNPPALECTGVSVTFKEPGLSVEVLKGVNLRVSRGASIAITGASGSGKSTLLQALGGLLKPAKGEIYLDGSSLHTLGTRQIGLVRNRYLGFVYQFHHLLVEFTALENVAMPLLIGGSTVSEAKEQAAEMLTRVGLDHRENHRPSELSGGERQRAAVARALINDPSCVLADEPTGNLDQQTAKGVQSLMLELVQDRGLALVIATHDPAFASKLDEQLELREGRLSAAG